MYLGSKLGCHQMPERSFFICGYQFPLCARCTGLIIGYIAAVITYSFICVPPIYCILICIPLILDGITQYLHWRESNQFLRFITGILCGIGSIQLELQIIIAVIKFN